MTGRAARTPRPCPDTVADYGRGTALEGLIGYKLRRAWSAVQADLAETLKPFDLRMLTFSALVLVRDNAGLSQAQLARLMSVERPNLVLIVDELDRRGLIARDRAAGDRRAYALSLTEAGRSLCNAAHAAVVAHEARMFDGLSPEDLSAFTAVLDRVRGNAPA